MSDADWYEKASVMGGFDSDEVQDGSPLSAHMVRATAMNANNLSQRIITLANLAWKYDASVQSVDVNLHACPPMWRRLFDPIPILKPPHIVAAWMYFDFLLGDSTDVADLVVMTNANFGPVGSNAGVSTTLTGSGHQSVTVGPFPMVQGEMDFIYTFVRGEETGDLMATGTYGSPNQISTPTWPGDNPGWLLSESGNSWNTRRIGADRPYVNLKDSSGDVIERRFVAEWVDNGASGGNLQLDSPLDGETMDNVASADIYRSTIVQPQSLLVRSAEVPV